MTQNTPEESFHAFKNSFSYGSRSDLNFKFLKHLSEQEAEARIDDFLREEPQLSIIPIETPPENLRVRHGGYDTRATLADPNVNFPIARLEELHQEGRLGNLAPDAYSFMGACSQLRLLNHTGPAWVAQLKAQGIEGVLMVPV